jgi:adenine-specific DNA methylase
MLDKIADFSTVLCRWGNDDEGVTGTFSRQAVPMVWDYAESNPVGFITGSLTWGISLVTRTLEHLCSADGFPARVSQGTSTALPWPAENFDAVFTDPPYYDNVPYSHLSDFFYVWLKRSVGDLYPELFATPLTPKTDEIVAYSNIEGGFEAGKKFFEDMLKKSFREIDRVLKPNGISVIVYAHKSFAGWETLINSLLDSGLVVTSAWPIHTEMKGRLISQESAALASSIYMIARKCQREKMAFYKDVKHEIQLLTAVVVTQMIATIITVYGILLPAMGWGLTMFIWAYALIAFVITDFLKLLGYRLLNHRGLRFSGQPDLVPRVIGAASVARAGTRESG